MASAPPIRVLFVCTHNSARSQIAEALLQRDGGERFDAYSAGTQVTGVNPYAVRVLAGEGIDWSGARSKSVSEFLGQAFEYVVTVCDDAREACPVFPGARRTIHWSLEDPSAAEGTDDQKLAAFQRTRSEVAARLAMFIEQARREADAARPAATTSEEGPSGISPRRERGRAAGASAGGRRRS